MSELPKSDEPSEPESGDDKPFSQAVTQASRPVAEDEPLDPEDELFMDADDWLALKNPHDTIAGKYQLVRILGEGGMGSVWVAHNQALDINVAIKLIRTEGPNKDRDALADRLLQEARAAARLRHPAIVRIHDFGKTETGDPYMAMELLDGEDLATILKRKGRVVAVRAARVLLPIVHGMVTAHDRSVMHRDIKPANIFLSRGPARQVQPKLIDFGVARLEQEHAIRLTWEGAFLGSPGYMSPEQARGEEADYQSDIWAISVVLFEMITGTLPFDAKNQLALVRRIIEDPPAEVATTDEAVLSLLPIVLRGLEKKLEDRYQSMRELGAAMATWLVDRGVRHDICGSSLDMMWLQFDPASPFKSPFATDFPADN